MTQAQKIAKDKFKKAIEYRKKTGVSLKEAFAHIYGKKVGAVKKKSAPKKKAAKKVAAIKIIEKGESKSAKSKAIYQQVRSKKGTFKGLKKVGALPKKKASASKRITDIHKDSKSHNVNIRVVSGMFENMNISSKKMYVRIWKNAYIWAGSFNSSKLREYLKTNVGKWIEIDTKFLFNNQYNTIDGYRLYDAHIDSVKNDARNYKNFPDKDVAFLDWKGIKPIIIHVDEKKIGSYNLVSYPELNYYRFSNARKTINFIFWDDTYFIFNGIGYKKSKRITGTYSGDSVPTDIKNKLHTYLKSEIASK